ncbi:Symplekin tight junction protein C terminal-domain-containing protein [Mortierella sp. GBAus27b]|nr:hypothetical protein BGX31_004580 [Mortierella sp. GBA43]KAI8358271.1 Symplekin tight junction protein C terminal-domain-containing protein [Mortierella sp. GBAus27b]
MASRDIQLALQSYLGQASLANNQQDLNRNLDAFSRDWKQEPTLEQFDTALGLVHESRGSPHGETIALWWMGFLQDIVLNDHIETYSPELNDALLKSVEPLSEMLMAQSPTLVKRALQVCATIYAIVFRVCCQDNIANAHLWNGYAVRIKQIAMGHFGSPNEGVILSLCKFIQTIIQIQSYSQPTPLPQDSVTSSLNNIPGNHPFLDANQLLNEADRHLHDLLSVIQRPSVSSTTVTAIVNQTSALQRARPQFIPIILGSWMSFVRPSLPTYFTPLQTRFVEKSIRIQLVAISKMQLQPPQTQALSEALSHYGVRFNGSALSRLQVQQLLHVDKDNGEESKRTGKRSRSANNQESDDIETKRLKADPETGGLSASAPPQPTAASSSIPAGFGQTLLGQLDITRLPLQHIIDIIFETLAANNVPHLFHSFLGALPLMRLGEGPLPIPPPGVGPPPPGLMLQRPPPPQLLPGMIPPHPGGLFPPPSGPGPHLLPHLPAGVPMPSMPENTLEIKPEIKQDAKREANLSKLQLPKIPDDVRVNITLRPPKRTPTQLPSRPIVVKSDAVTMSSVPRKEGQPEKDVKVEPKVEIEEQQRLLKQETFQVKPFEPSIERPGVSSATPLMRQLLEQTFDRVLTSEHLFSVPGASGRRMLEGAVPSHRQSEQGLEDGDGMVPHEPGNTAKQSKVITKADWTTIVARLLTRTFTRDSQTIDTESDHQGVKEKMIDYICKDFKQRRELALTWLHEEWYYDIDICRRQSGDMDEREPQYLWCLYKILEGITTGATLLDARDRGLSRFLLEVPELPDDAVDTLQRFCDDPARTQLGIGCLRDIVNLRPPSRPRALEILLSYTASSEKLQRSMAIVTAKKWYLEHATVGPKVEDFALSQLETLIGYPVPRLEASIPNETSAEASESMAMKMEDLEHQTAQFSTENANGIIKHEDFATLTTTMNPSAASTVSRTTPESLERALALAEEDIGRRSELYFSLCAKNHSLLGVLLEHYSSYEPFVQRVVRQKIQPLIKSIKSDSAKLLALIRNFPMGAEMLVLRIIFILTDGVHPSANLVSTVQQAVVEHDLNARFLIPIIGGLDRGEVFACLPRIVSLLKGTERERRTVTEVFMKLLTGAPGTSASGTSNPPLGITRRDSSTTSLHGTATLASVPSSQVQGQPGSSQARGPVMSPSELLIELHAMEDTVGWKSACEAMDICFNHPELYKSEIIAVVLQQLLDRPTIPSLFMRTVIQAITLYKNLVGFVNSMILAKLVQKKIWTRPVLWKGFVRCAKMMQPTSSSVLATLPKPQLKEVLSMEPMLKEPIDAYIKAKSSGRRVGGGAAKQINVLNAVSSTPVQPPQPTISDGAQDDIRKVSDVASEEPGPPKTEGDDMLET